MGGAKNLLTSGVLVAVVVVLALVVKAGHASPAFTFPERSTPHNTGAIVIERQRFIDPRIRGKSADVPVIETLTETSKRGGLIAIYSSADSAGADQQELDIGKFEQIYDPRDDTIYVTTFRAVVAAQQRLFEERLPKGSEGSSSTDTQFTYGSSASPGWTSEYLQDLRNHSYRIAGETTVDGRAALKLIPTPASRKEGSGYESFPTVYVSPGSFDPLKEVTRFQLPARGSAESVTTDWLEYKVIPATPANQRLLSLTAQHPTATISHSAMAYVRATTPKGQL